jgi:hypothetical protein
MACEAAAAKGLTPTPKAEKTLWPLEPGFPKVAAREFKPTLAEELEH